MNWRSKRAVVTLIAVVCAVIFVAGMGAAWHNRHHSICPGGAAPVAENENGLLGQVLYVCPDGRTVTN